MPSFAEPPFQRYEKLNDGTIISGEHVIRSIQEFESKIKVIKTEHGDAVVYAVTSNDQNAETYKIVIGTVEIDVAVDKNKFMTVIEVYRPVARFKLPRGLEICARASRLPLDTLPFTRGSLTLKLGGKDVVLVYSFDAFGPLMEADSSSSLSPGFER